MDEKRAEEIKGQLVAWVGELWDLHRDEIADMAESSGGRIGINFPIELELSQDGGQDHVRLGMDCKLVRKLTDSRECAFGDPDPDQEKLPLDNDSGENPPAPENVLEVGESSDDKPDPEQAVPKKRGRKKQAESVEA